MAGRPEAYKWSVKRFGRVDTGFCAGSFVVDFADSLSRETREPWTYRRTLSQDGWTGPYSHCGVTRKRDGLTISIAVEAYNRADRGRASVWLKESGCGDSHPRYALPQSTFDPSRPLKSIARQVLSKVIEPSIGTVMQLQEMHKQRTDTISLVDMRLQSLSRLPGVRVSRNAHSETLVHIGPITCRVGPTGYVEIISRGGLELDDLAPLAEHFESIKRQMAG